MKLLKNYPAAILCGFWLLALLNPVFKKYDYGAGWPLVLILGVILALFVASGWKNKQTKLGLEFPFLLLFLLGLALSYVYSDVATLGFSEVMAFSACGVLYLLLSQRRLPWMEDFLKVVAVAGGLAVFVGFFLYFTEAEVRMAGPFFNILYHANVWPNAFALFLLLLWPVYLLFWEKKHFHWVGIALAFAISALLLSYSRGALIAFAGQIFLLGLIFRRKVLKKESLVRLFITAILTLGIFAGANELRDNRFEVIDVEERANFDNQEGLTSKQERVDFWLGALELIKEKPLLGWGPFSFRYAYNPIQKTLLGAADHPHNLFLKIGAENGLPALLAFIAFLLVISINVLRSYPKLSRKKKKQAALLSVAVAGALAHSLIDYNFNFIANLLLLFIYIAFLTSLTREKLKQSQFKKYLVFALATALASLSLFEGYILLRAEFQDEDYLSQSFFPRNYYLNEADAALKKNDHDIALSYLFLQLKKNRLDPQAYYLRGAVYCNEDYEEQDLLKCKDNFKKAIELNPLNDWNYYRDYLRVLSKMPGKNLNPEIEEFLKEVLPLIDSYFFMVKNNVHFTAYTPNVEAAAELVELILDLPGAYLENSQRDFLKAGRRDMLEKAEELRNEKTY